MTSHARDRGGERILSKLVALIVLLGGASGCHTAHVPSHVDGAPPRANAVADAGDADAGGATDAGAAPDGGAAPDAGDLRRAACERADANACVELAESLRNGGGPTADRARNIEALSLFEKSCEADHARGCEGVAEMLQDHRYYGVRDDAEGTVRAWDKACRLGNHHACYRFGFYSWEGLTRGLVIERDGHLRPFRWPQDRARGLELMHRACVAGVKESCEREREARGGGGG